MSLQGTLDTFSLPDVLRFLASSTKTGRLLVKNPRGGGEVWLDEGSVIAAESGAATVAVDVLFELLRESEGSFNFEAELTRSDAGDAQAVDDLLSQAEARLTEWHAIEAVVPSLACGLALAEDIPGGAVRIESDQWKVLVAAATEGTVGRVGDRLGMGEFDVSRAIKELVERGLLEIEGATTAVRDTAEAPARRQKPAKRSPKADTAAPAEAPALELVADDVAGTDAAEEASELAGLDPDVARQIAELGPEAAKAVAEAARATTDEERERALEGVGDDDPINRGLLLKFLSSVRT